MSFARPCASRPRRFLVLRSALHILSPAVLVIAARTARKLFVFLAGSLILLVGVAMIVLPGPAIVVIPAGLAVLSIEFVWARELLTWMRTRAHEVRRSPRWPLSIRRAFARRQLRSQLAR